MFVCDHADPSNLLGALKMPITASTLSVAQLKEQTVKFLHENVNDGNKVYTCHSVKPAHALDYSENDTATFEVEAHEDFWATISIKVDTTQTVKPLQSLKVEATDKFTTLKKFTYYEKNPNMVKVRLPDLAQVSKDSKVVTDFKERSFHIYVYEHQGKNYDFGVPKL